MISMRTKEGLEIAREKGRLRGKPPKLSERQHASCWPSTSSGLRGRPCHDLPDRQPSETNARVPMTAGEDRNPLDSAYQQLRRSLRRHRPLAKRLLRPGP
ncbi:hypothetical protein DXX98_08985 [Janibacter melonis]|nr:hypothetical protein [Janibacter melonis]